MLFYRNIIDFCMMILYYETLLNLCVIASAFFLYTQYFLCIQLCHLQIKIFLFLSFQSMCILLLYYTVYLLLGDPVYLLVCLFLSLVLSAFTSINFESLVLGALMFRITMSLWRNHSYPYKAVFFPSNISWFLIFPHIFTISDTFHFYM